MHHLVSGINFQIHFVSLTSLVSVHLLIRLSIPLFHHHHHHHVGVHYFTVSLQVQSVPFQQILLIIVLLCTPALPSWIIELCRA